MGRNKPNPKTARNWEHFHHVADVGVRGYGDNLCEAFEQAALAMVAITAELESIGTGQSVTVELEAPNVEILLADWLNAIVFQMATRQLLFSRFEVVIEGVSLSGRMHGEAVDVERHRPAAEVKGATLSELAVGQDKHGRWFAQCVVDV